MFSIARCKKGTVIKAWSLSYYLFTTEPQKTNEEALGSEICRYPSVEIVIGV